MNSIWECHRGKRWLRGERAYNKPGTPELRVVHSGQDSALELQSTEPEKLGSALTVLILGSASKRQVAPAFRPLDH